MAKNPRYNPTVGHFVHKKPDYVRVTGEKRQKPPEFKFDLFPLRWTAPIPSAETDYLKSVPHFATMPKHYKLFLDTGFLTSHEIPQEFWDAFVDKHLCLTTDVWQELQPWVENPKCNVWMPDYLVNAIAEEQAGIGHARVSLVSIDDLPSDMAEVANHYVDLLYLRKHYGKQQAERFEIKNGKKPTSAELQKLCAPFIGERGWRFMQKVIESEKPINANDEKTLVNAVFHSILFGDDVVILTRDTDLLEQFYKLVYLIDTHYHSMKLAEIYQQNPGGYELEALPENPLFYKGEGNICINMDHKMVKDIIAQPYQCNCVLFSTSTQPLMTSQRCFVIIRDMERVLQMKARTKGRNTDLFGTMNFHVILDPAYCYGGWGCSIVNDRYLEGKDNGRFKISANDSHLALFTNEGFAQERPEVDSD